MFVALACFLRWGESGTRETNKGQLMCCILCVTQGFIVPPPPCLSYGLWAALKAQWNLRCAKKYQHQQATLEEFVALWAGILERWGGGGAEHVVLQGGPPPSEFTVAWLVRITHCVF